MALKYDFDLGQVVDDSIVTDAPKNPTGAGEIVPLQPTPSMPAADSLSQPAPVLAETPAAAPAIPEPKLFQNKTADTVGKFLLNLDPAVGWAESVMLSAPTKRLNYGINTDDDLSFAQAEETKEQALFRYKTGLIEKGYDLQDLKSKADIKDDRDDSGVGPDDPRYDSFVEELYRTDKARVQAGQPAPAPANQSLGDRALDWAKALPGQFAYQAMFFQTAKAGANGVVKKAWPLLPFYFLGEVVDKSAKRMAGSGEVDDNGNYIPTEYKRGIADSITRAALSATANIAVEMGAGKAATAGLGRLVASATPEFAKTAARAVIAPAVDFLAKKTATARAAMNRFAVDKIGDEFMEEVYGSVAESFINTEPQRDAETGKLLNPAQRFVATASNFIDTLPETLATLATMQAVGAGLGRMESASARRKYMAEYKGLTAEQADHVMEQPTYEKRVLALNSILSAPKPLTVSSPDKAEAAASIQADAEEQAKSWDVVNTSLAEGEPDPGARAYYQSGQYQSDVSAGSFVDFDQDGKISGVDAKTSDRNKILAAEATVALNSASATPQQKEAAVRVLNHFASIGRQVRFQSGDQAKTDWMQTKAALAEAKEAGNAEAVAKLTIQAEQRYEAMKQARGASFARAASEDLAKQSGNPTDIISAKSEAARSIIETQGQPDGKNVEPTAVVEPVAPPVAAPAPAPEPVAPVVEAQPATPEQQVADLQDRLNMLHAAGDISKGLGDYKLLKLALGAKVPKWETMSAAAKKAQKVVKPVVRKAAKVEPVAPAPVFDVAPVAVPAPSPVVSAPVADAIPAPVAAPSTPRPLSGPVHIRHFSRSGVDRSRKGSMSFWDMTNPRVAGAENEGSNFWDKEAKETVDATVDGSKIYQADSGVDKQLDILLRQSPDFQMDTRYDNRKDWTKGDRKIASRLKELGYLGFKYAPSSRFANEIVIIDANTVLPARADIPAEEIPAPLPVVPQAWDDKAQKIAENRGFTPKGKVETAKQIDKADAEEAKQPVAEGAKGTKISRKWKRFLRATSPVAAAKRKVKEQRRLASNKNKGFAKLPVAGRIIQLGGLQRKGDAEKHAKAMGLPMGGHWDGARDINYPPFNAKLYSPSGTPPDIMADRLNMTVNDMWAALAREKKIFQSGELAKKQPDEEGEVVDEDAINAARFYKQIESKTKKYGSNKTLVDATTLNVGDVITVVKVAKDKGKLITETIKVIDIDPENGAIYVRTESYGETIISPDAKFYAKKIDRAEVVDDSFDVAPIEPPVNAEDEASFDVAEIESGEPQYPNEPAAPAAAPDGQGQLLGQDEGGFALISDKAPDNFAIDAERKRLEDIQEQNRKAQGELFGDENGKEAEGQDPNLRDNSGKPALYTRDEQRRDTDRLREGFAETGYGAEAEVLAESQVDQAFRITDTGKKIIARAARIGVKVSFFRSEIKDRFLGTISQDGATIFVATGNGMESIIADHEIFHALIKQKDPDAWALLGLVAPGSTVFAVYNEKYGSPKRLARHNMVFVAEEIAADMFAGHTDFYGVNPVDSIAPESLKLAARYVSFMTQKIKPESDLPPAVGDMEQKFMRAARTADVPDIRDPNNPRLASKETARILDKAPTVKLYRAMASIDGKLYPPMSGKEEGGKLRPPEPIGVWMRSEERPDLVPKSGKNAGKFPLRKPFEGTVWALYAPYFHSSQSPLNDQFSAAWRTNNVIVEVEVPASELTSGFTAKVSTKSVGEHEWSGTATSKALGDRRKVVLSRWAKINRVVPNDELAGMIADIVKPKDVTIPDNILPRDLRSELEKRGVKIEESGLVDQQKQDDFRFMRPATSLSNADKKAEAADASISGDNKDRPQTILIQSGRSGNVAGVLSENKRTRIDRKSASEKVDEQNPYEPVFGTHSREEKATAKEAYAQAIADLKTASEGMKPEFGQDLVSEPQRLKFAKAVQSVIDSARANAAAMTRKDYNEIWDYIQAALPKTEPVFKSDGTPLMRTLKDGSEVQVRRARPDNVKYREQAVKALLKMNISNENQVGDFFAGLEKITHESDKAFTIQRIRQLMATGATSMKIHGRYREIIQQLMGKFGTQAKVEGRISEIDAARNLNLAASESRLKELEAMPKNAKGMPEGHAGEYVKVREQIKKHGVAIATAGMSLEQMVKKVDQMRKDGSITKDMEAFAKRMIFVQKYQESGGRSLGDLSLGALSAMAYDLEHMIGTGTAELALNEAAKAAMVSEDARFIALQDGMRALRPAKPVMGEDEDPEAYAARLKAWQENPDTKPVKKPLESDGDFSARMEKWKQNAYFNLNKLRRTYSLNYLPIDALFDWYDGGMGYNGALYQRVRGKLEYYENALAGEKMMDKELIDKVIIPLKITPQENAKLSILSMYNQKNGAKEIAKHVEEGTFTAKEISDLIAEFEANKTAQGPRFAPTEDGIRLNTAYDFVMQLNEKTGARLKDTMLSVYNKVMEKVENYAVWYKTQVESDDTVVDDDGLEFQPLAGTSYYVSKDMKKLRSFTGTETNITKTRVGGGGLVNTDFLGTAVRAHNNALRIIHLAAAHQHAIKVIKSDAVGEKIGEGGQNMLIDWLTTSATNGSEAERMMSPRMKKLMHNLGAFVLAFKLTSMLKQLSQLATGAGAVGAPRMAKAMADYINSPDLKKWAKTNFPQVAARMGGDPAMQEYRKKMLGRHTVTSAGFVPLQELDMFSAMVTGVAAYRKWHEEKYPGQEIDYTKAADPDGVNKAQLDVRRTSASSAVKDVPLFLSRGFSNDAWGVTTGKLVHQFQNFPISTGSTLIYEISQMFAGQMQARNWANVTRMMAGAIGAMAVARGVDVGNMAVMQWLMEMMGEPPTKEPEEFTDWKAWLRNFFMLIPGATTVSNVLLPRGSRTGLPVADAFRQAGTNILEATGDISKERYSQAALNASEGAAALFGLGTGRLPGAATVIDYMDRFFDEDR